MSERDDLFGDDSPEEKKPVKGREEEDFFFDIDEEDLQDAEAEDAKSPSEEPEEFISEEEIPPLAETEDFAADEVPDEVKPVVAAEKGGSRSRILLLLFLVVLLLGGGYFYLGDTLFAPEPTQVKQVVKSPPKKMKVPERKEIKQEQAAVKEVAMPTEKVAAAPAEKPKSPAAEQEGKAAPVDAEPKAQAAPEEAKQESVKAEKQPAEAVAKAEPAEQPKTAAVKPAVPATAEEQPMKAAAEKAAPYTLQIGAFVLATNLDETLKTVKSLGYQPSILDGTKTVSMTRLKVGTYAPEEARTRLKEVQQLVPSAFVLKEGDQLTVYAGSFYLIDRARVQADRLFQHEVRVEEVKADVAVPIKTIRFGAFDNPESAKQAVEQARQAGLETLVIKQN